MVINGNKIYCRYCRLSKLRSNLKHKTYIQLKCYVSNVNKYNYMVMTNNAITSCSINQIPMHYFPINVCFGHLIFYEALNTCSVDHLQKGDYDI